MSRYYLPCRHCHRNPIGRPRGLCWSCYYAPGVRERYPISQSKYAKRGVDNNLGQRAEPTDATPGTAAKIAVLAARAARGELLFHPQDCTVNLS